MSRSVMIEVDETTKSILEKIESQITRGTDQSLQGFKNENNTVLQAMSSQLHDRIQIMEKNVNKETSRLERNVEDLLDTIEDNFSETSKSIEGMKNEQIDVIKKILLASNEELFIKFSEKFTVLEQSSQSLNKEITKLSDIPSNLNQSIQKVSEEMNNNLEQIQTDFKEQLTAGMHKQEEQVKALITSLETLIHSIDKKQEEHELHIQSFLEGMESKMIAHLNQTEAKVLNNLNVKEEMSLMTEKLSILEKELERANQPFYKKWFRKKGDSYNDINS